MKPSLENFVSPLFFGRRPAKTVRKHTKVLEAVGDHFGCRENPVKRPGPSPQAQVFHSLAVSQLTKLDWANLQLLCKP